MIPQEYQDIAPYTDDQFSQKMETLVNEPGFEHAVRYVMPDVDYPAFAQELLAVKTQEEFQHKIMRSFLEMLAMKTTGGVSGHGFEHLDPAVARTFITNHRDIVLDASFLNLCLLRTGHPTCQVALGNNLLIFSWIEDLVKLNKSFIVKRNLPAKQALEAARQLSSYMHYCIGELKQSTWIAQREGRAKDSNDLTQESLIKMLSLAGGGTPLENLKALNITPTAISYQYDPCDYLKAQEYLRKARDPEFIKSQRDDLFSMETGILGYKGQVIFNAGESINPDLERLNPGIDRQETVHAAAGIIDNMIHRGYHIFPHNYIAYDRVENTAAFTTHYDAEEIAKFDHYLDQQLDKVEVKDVTPQEREFMRGKMMEMYANPLRNKLQAEKLKTGF